MSLYVVDIHGEIEGDYEIISEYVPIKTGKWIVHMDCEGETRYCECDRCGYKTGKYTWKNPNFCENCGADMRETLKDPEKRKQAGLDFDGDWVDFYNVIINGDIEGNYAIIEKQAMQITEMFLDIADKQNKTLKEVVEIYYNIIKILIEEINDGYFRKRT